ncbi:hypothetical protein CU098_003465 [Rhizopus stolonifer]|uniref:Uncharacterized protein n=1 Tax=Rhizopus stolonifer TaxID=4846 RepID=A0A367KTF9_RHIST|nr:hypothetical protein CU098_003465 [Rhizopus stolonifer]
MKFANIISITSLFFFSVISAQEQQCEGVEILYPKTDSIIERSQDGSSTYLLLGNTGSTESSLLKVSLVHAEDQGDIEEEVWTGSDKLLRVSAVQHDLTKIDSKSLPNTFWFRVLVNQHDVQCQLNSGKFKINA